MTPSELAVHRFNTFAFIQADPIKVNLKRNPRVRNAAGGYTTGPTQAVAPQTVRLIPASDKMPEIKSSTGRLVKPDYILLAEHTADIRRWDTFELNGIVFELASPVRPEHTVEKYELKADVVRREDA